jgi:hypothetical protein
MHALAGSRGDSRLQEALLEPAAAVSPTMRLNAVACLHAVAAAAVVECWAPLLPCLHAAERALLAALYDSSGGGAAPLALAASASEWLQRQAPAPAAPAAAAAVLVEGYGLGRLPLATALLPLPPRVPPLPHLDAKSPPVPLLFAPRFARPLPPLFPVAPAEVHWLPGLAPLPPQPWPPSTESEAASGAAAPAPGIDPRFDQIRFLLGRAADGPLAPTQQQALVDVLRGPDGPATAVGVQLPPALLGSLVEHSPVIAVDYLLGLAASGTGAGQWRAALDALAAIDLSLHSLEVVNRLSTASVIINRCLALFIYQLICQDGGITVLPPPPRLTLVADVDGGFTCRLYRRLCSFQHRHLRPYDGAWRAPRE